MWVHFAAQCVEYMYLENRMKLTKFSLVDFLLINPITLEKPEGVIKNGQSRDTDIIAHKRHRTHKKTSKLKWWTTWTPPKTRRWPKVLEKCSHFLYLIRHSPSGRSISALSLTKQNYKQFIMQLNRSQWHKL